jgi:branched-chain amino acid transport system substrate-binding protein
MRHWSKGAALVACLALAVGAAACGSDDSSSSSSGSAAAPASTAAGTTSTPASTAGKVKQSTIDAGLAFTGGKAGKADASLPPVTIGYVNQEGGAPSFVEYHGVTTEAVKFINNELGGIDGHPIKLEECIIQAEEDGQKCGAQFRANKDIHIAILGLAVVGNLSFYKTVGNAFPVLVDVAATGPDGTTKGVYNLDAGGLGVLNAEATAVKAIDAKTVALLTADNPSGKNTAVTVQAPRMKALGITPKVVLFPDTATTPDFVTSLTNSGGDKADALAFNPSANAQCNQVYDSLKQLGADTPVITNVFCAADEVVKHIGDGMNGWVFSSFGWNPRVAGDPQGDAYTDVMAAAGKPELTNAGYTFKSFADLMAIAKFGTDIGYDNLSAKAFDDAINGWAGPGWMIPGSMKCGAQKVLISICGTAARNSTFADGQWKDMGPVELPKG